MRLGLDAGELSVIASQELGICGVPVAATELVTKGVEAVVKPLQALGLEICQIGAFGYNPLHPDTTLLAAQTEIVRKAILYAPQTGCRYVVICGGNVHPSGFAHGHRDNFTGAALERIAETLRPLLMLAEDSGVLLCIEPYIKSAICSPERFMKLAAMVQSPALRINIDVTNFYDLHDMWNPSSTIRRTCRRLKGRYGLVHVKDLTLREGFHIHSDLTPLGTGVTDWTLVVREIAPYVPDTSWVIVEHVNSLDEARQSVAFLRKTAREAGIELT